MKNYNRALIIDADAGLSRALKSELSNVIPDISCARTKTMAVELFHKLHPDIVFIDTDFPDAEVTELVRLVKCGYAPMVVFMTSVAKAINGAGIEFRTEDCLEKPLIAALELFRQFSNSGNEERELINERSGRGGLRRQLGLLFSIAKRGGF